MAKWHYYNENGEKISVTGGQLKGLAKAGVITRDTIVETEGGKSAPARRIKGLKFAEPAQSKPLPTVPILPVEATDAETNWHYYNENGEKISVTVEHLKRLAKNGYIAPDTFVITPSGRTAFAKDVNGLTVTETVQPKPIPKAIPLATKPLPSIPVPPVSVPIRGENYNSFSGKQLNNNWMEDNWHYLVCFIVGVGCSIFFFFSAGGIVKTIFSLVYLLVFKPASFFG